jgi:hypothetical protein
MEKYNEVLNKPDEYLKERLNVHAQFKHELANLKHKYGDKGRLIIIKILQKLPINFTEVDL